MAEAHPISNSRTPIRHLNDSPTHSPPLTETVPSTPRDAFFSMNVDSDNTSHSQGSSRTQTALGYSRLSVSLPSRHGNHGVTDIPIKTKDLETTSVGRRASSEPTPTLPVVDLDSEPPETPLEETFEDDGATSGEHEPDYEQDTRSVYVTPSEEIIISPARTLQTLSYDRSVRAVEPVLLD